MEAIEIAQPLEYVPGLDELAEAIGAKPGEDTFGITMRGKSGRQFDLTSLMMAFVRYLAQAEARIADALDEAYELSDTGEPDEPDDDLLSFDDSLDLLEYQK